MAVVGSIFKLDSWSSCLPTPFDPNRTVPGAGLLMKGPFCQVACCKRLVSGGKNANVWRLSFPTKRESDKVKGQSLLSEGNH